METTNNNMPLFESIKIEDADLDLMGDYAIYCDGKISIDEMPLSFEQWQIANNDIS